MNSRSLLAVNFYYQLSIKKVEPLISVIVPVYNVEDYLDQCMESIVGQNYPHLEILMVDDGSTDNSGALCDQWAERDQRIRVIHQENGGLSAARNTALDAMSGELVIMVDSDDVLHPDAVSILLQAIQAHHADVVIGSFVVFDGMDVNWPRITSENTVRHYDSQAALKAIFYQDKLTNSSCWRLFKASLFDDVRYPVGKYYEDLAIVYPLYKKCSLVVGIDDAVYGYRQRNDSILGRFSLKRADVLDICEQLERQVLTEDVELLHAVRSRLLSAYFNILLLSYQDKEQDFKELQDRCWKGIKRLRHNCLIDSNVRPKNKAGIIASYLGRTFLCDILGKRYHPKR